MCIILYLFKNQYKDKTSFISDERHDTQGSKKKNRTSIKLLRFKLTQYVVNSCRLIINSDHTFIYHYLFQKSYGSFDPHPIPPMRLFVQIIVTDMFNRTVLFPLRVLTRLSDVDHFNNAFELFYIFNRFKSLSNILYYADFAHFQSVSLFLH